MCQRQNIVDNNAIIDGEDVKHIYKVLRLKVGDKVSVNNCEGKEYIGEITLIDKKCSKYKSIRRKFYK